MPHLYDGWCDHVLHQEGNGKIIHVFTEKNGARSKAHPAIVAAISSHYENPSHLADRIKRLGYKKAAAILTAMLPKTIKARSGHVGEILATEVVPAILPSFEIPIKRLRWLDGRESALRGEDLIGIARQRNRTRFLKGESKSRASLSPGVVNEARKALKANKGRPSQHAMAFVMHRLLEAGEKALALEFENYLLQQSIKADDMVHLLFGFSGNDASDALKNDLKEYSGNIEQHAVALRVVDHQTFISSLY